MGRHCTAPSRHCQLPSLLPAWLPGGQVIVPPQKPWTVPRPGRNCSIHRQNLSLRSTPWAGPHPARPQGIPQAQFGITGVHSCPPYQTGCSPRTGPGLSSLTPPPPSTGCPNPEKVLEKGPPRARCRAVEKGTHSVWGAVGSSPGLLQGWEGDPAPR